MVSSKSMFTKYSGAMHVNAFILDFSVPRYIKEPNLLSEVTGWYETSATASRISLTVF